MNFEDLFKYDTEMFYKEYDENHKESGLLINNDCIKVMDKIAENTVDCIICDPPYNISRETNFDTLKGASRNGMDFGEWDKDFDLTGFIDKFPKILKDNSNVVIFNAWENLKTIKDACTKNNITVKRCLVLRKSNPAPFNRDRMFVNDVEFALWGIYNSKNKPTKWTFNRMNGFERCVLDTTVQSAKYHPTMKDIKIIKYLVELLTNENDIVLDCFSGSGTTALACKELNRRFIGIELDKKYFDIAKERLSNE